jgi:hypothetical protein
MSSVDSRLSTVFFEAIAGFLHLNSSLLMLTKVEVLQVSENLRNHSAGPMIFAGSMRYEGILRKREPNRQTGAFAVEDRPSGT